MKNLLIKYSFCFFLFIILSCDSKSEEVVLPSVVITNSQSLHQGGVALTADFQNFTEVDKLGFYVSSNAGSKEYLIANPENGQNTIHITSGLYQDKKYYFYAFIKTPEDVFFASHTKEFYALTGSVIPKIQSITPAFGYIGGEIEISFSDKFDISEASEFSIKLHTQDVEIINIVDNQNIICRVPDFIPTSGYYRYPWAKMSIKYLGKIIPYDYVFNIKAPRIDSISPEFIDWSGEISIKGDFFEEGYPSNYIIVNINGVPMVNKTYISHNEIRVEVSKHMFVNNPEVVVSSNFRHVAKKNTFSYYPPEIVSFQEGVIGDEIEIIGKYFWPASYVNEVYFDNYKAEIISGESTKLVVKVPEGTYINNKAMLRVSTTKELISEAKEFIFN